MSDGKGLLSAAPKANDESVNFARDISIFQLQKLIDPLWRYMSFTKFLSVLERKAIFFPIASSLPDGMEGHIYSEKSILQMQALESIIEKNSGMAPNPMSHSKIAGLTRQLQELIRGYICISSWHRSKIESHAMWKVYVPGGEGVAIKTTASKLTKSLSRQTKYEVLLGDVVYSRPKQIDDNYLAPYIYKRPEFGAEEEVRAVVDLFKEGKNRVALDEIYPQNGIYVEVDLDMLIQEVVISPDAPEWIVDLLRRQIGKFGFKDSILYESALASR